MKYVYGILILILMTGCQAPSNGGGNSDSPPQIPTLGPQQGSKEVVFEHFAYITGVANDHIYQYGIDPQTYQLIGLNPDFETSQVGAGSCQMVIHPNGKFLYVSNCKTNTVSQYSINPTSGLLTRLSPFTVSTSSGSPMLIRNIGFDTAGKFYASYYKTGSAYIDYLGKFNVNNSTGQLTFSNFPAVSSPGFSGVVENFLATTPTIHLTTYLAVTMTQTVVLDQMSYVLRSSFDNVELLDNGNSTSYTTYLTLPMMMVVH